MSKLIFKKYLRYYYINNVETNIEKIKENIIKIVTNFIYMEITSKYIYMRHTADLVFIKSNFAQQHKKKIIKQLQGTSNPWKIDKWIENSYLIHILVQ